MSELHHKSDEFHYPEEDLLFIGSSEEESTEKSTKKTKTKRPPSTVSLLKHNEQEIQKKKTKSDLKIWERF